MLGKKPKGRGARKGKKKCSPSFAKGKKKMVRVFREEIIPPRTRIKIAEQAEKGGLPLT